jgi:hypothetical protein
LNKFLKHNIKDTLKAQKWASQLLSNNHPDNFIYLNILCLSEINCSLKIVQCNLAIVQETNTTDIEN